MLGTTRLLPGRGAASLPHSTSRHALLAGVMLLCLALLAGCGIPRDPDGTLERVQQAGELRVGIVLAPPHTVLRGTTWSGPEVELVQGFADELGVRVAWVSGSEEQTVDRAEHGEVDLMVGGLTTRTGWSTQVGLSRPYAEERDDYGRTARRVMAVPLGENALLERLERHFDARKQP
ncbi:MAG: transporter substrate-binding domain-containing protein [Actinomycetes bacterium]